MPMVSQSATSIIYTSKKWRAALDVSIFLFLALPCILPAALGLYFDGPEDLGDPLLFTLSIIGYGIIVATIFPMRLGAYFSRTAFRSQQKA